MRQLLCAWTLLSLAAPARAVELGLRQTFGEDSYKGTYAYAELPAGPLSLRPELDLYSSDNTQGTFKTFSARLGYDTAVFGLGGTLGTTPEVDGYSNAFAGVDGTLTVSATGGGAKRIRTSGGGAPRGKGLARVDVGAGVMVTKHQDALDSSRGKRGSKFEISQRDLSLFAGASFVGLHLSGNLTASSYDKDLTSADRFAQRLRLEGVESRLSGFPKNSLTLRGEIPFLPLVTPFLSYNRTSYELSPLKTRTVGLGASVGLEMLELYGRFEATHPTGLAGLEDSTAVTVGASLRFGLGG